MSTPHRIDLQTGRITGRDVAVSRKTIGDLKGYFYDEAARSSLPQELECYRVEAWEPVAEGTMGAVCAATTWLHPGRVGDEYFLTRGHFHAHEDRPELETTLSGHGMLVLMERDGTTRTEEMTPGSLHHVPPGTAHRVANIGSEDLVFVSWWASETGHDYAPIAEKGFGVRVVLADGRPVVVPR
jgi:glucose-6-phosphate isomerase